MYKLFIIILQANRKQKRVPEKNNWKQPNLQNVNLKSGTFIAFSEHCRDAHERGFHHDLNVDLEPVVRGFAASAATRHIPPNHFPEARPKTGQEQDLSSRVSRVAGTGPETGSRNHVDVKSRNRPEGLLLAEAVRGYHHSGEAEKCSGTNAIKYFCCNWTAINNGKIMLHYFIL